ncbi:MAG: glycosyltransferase family 39 protein, partial [Elusimicrobia bacterium]|nr:glycosyltransferase family 39 protein [Elusimicrobiota bacterium]
MARFKTGIFLAGILLGQALLGFLYLNKTGIFNAPDEPYHLNYVAYLSARGRLPVAASRDMSEAIQPPLYYLSALPLYKLTRGFGLPACVKALRAQNLLYAILNVWLIFLLLRRVDGEQTALLGAAFAAFLPQYLFISASVSNDALACLLATLILYGGLWLLESPDSMPRAAAEGLLIGLGLLAKLTTVCCAAAVVLVYARQKRKDKARAVGGPLTMAAAALALGGLAPVAQLPALRRLRGRARDVPRVGDALERVGNLVPQALRKLLGALRLDGLAASQSGLPHLGDRNGRHRRGLSVVVAPPSGAPARP